MNVAVGLKGNTLHAHHLVSGPYQTIFLPGRCPHRNVGGEPLTQNAFTCPPLLRKEL